MVQIGEKTIDYNEEFRLFLTTRNPAPEIPPDAASIITEVNFTTTKAGLTGQVGLSSQRSTLIQSYRTGMFIVTEVNFNTVLLDRFVYQHTGMVQLLRNKLIFLAL